MIEQPVINRPDRRLGAIARAYLSQDRFYVRFHGRFCDVEISRHMLVGISHDDALQDGDLSRGQLLDRLWVIGRYPGDFTLERRHQPLLGLWLNLERPEA